MRVLAICAVLALIGCSKAPSKKPAEPGDNLSKDVVSITQIAQNLQIEYLKNGALNKDKAASKGLLHRCLRLNILSSHSYEFAPISDEPYCAELISALQKISVRGIGEAVDLSAN